MKKLESGRSMVEMLGVLAIIGVLSIGGIAGYVLSMNRYRANAMLDVANKYAAIVFSSYQSYVASGGAVASYKAPTLATSKLDGTLQAGTSIAALAEGEGETLNNSAAVSGNNVHLAIAFPNQDICETALGVAGYDVGTAVSEGEIPTVPSSGNTRSCSAEPERADTNGNKLSYGVFTFKQS